MYFWQLRVAIAALALVAGSEANDEQDGYLRVWPAESEFEGQGTIPLYFGLCFSFGGSFDSSSGVPGVQVALNQINSDPYMLPGYTLHYTLTDSQVSSMHVWLQDYSWKRNNNTCR